MAILLFMAIYVYYLWLFMDDCFMTDYCLSAFLMVLSCLMMVVNVPYMMMAKSLWSGDGNGLIHTPQC